MSTLAEVQAALPQLTAAELAEVERLARAARVDKEKSPSGEVTAPSAARPKVGTTIDQTCHIPDSAFLPLTDEELKAWGL